MADIKISNLTAGGSLTGSEVLPGDGGSPLATYKWTVDQVKTYCGTASVTSPTTITTNSNDYDLGAQAFVRIAASTAVNLTGFTNGSTGVAKVVVNVGATHSITIKHANTNSSTANRVNVPWAGDCVMAANGGVAIVLYDPTSSVWRVL